MTRLLLASTVPSFMEAFLLPYARHFRAQGWRVDAISNGVACNSECSAAFERVWNVHWSRNPLDPSNLLLAPGAVNKIVEAGAYDIIHVHTPVAGLVCRYARRGRHAPVRIYTAHGFHFHDNGSHLKNAVFLNLEKLAGRRWTDYLVVINRSDETSAKQHHIIDPERLVYMPGIGLDTRDKYNPGSVDQREIDAFKRSLNLAPAAPVLLMLAEFVPGKRHRDALRAFARVERPTAHLVLAGSGPVMEAMKDLARSLGISTRVHFLGNRRDVPILIRAAAALLLCSEREGLPRSVMEAMALGTPVIGTDIRGIRELLEGGAGYIAKLGDIEELARIITWVLDHPGEASTASRTARERVSQYEVQRIISMHEELYARAMREKTSCFGAMEVAAEHQLEV
jgi:glycosyltransferase involved in cell wall biosynthesis